MEPEINTCTTKKKTRQRVRTKRVSRIYYNPDHKSKEDEYVYAIPLTVKEFYFDGKLQKPEFFNVKYVNGDAFFVKQVYGIPVSGEKIARYKTGWSREGFYGRSSKRVARRRQQHERNHEQLGYNK
jgi:hypothetical protein